MIIAPVSLLNKSLNPWCFRTNKTQCFNIYYSAPEKGCGVHCTWGATLIIAPGKHGVSTSIKDSETVFPLMQKKSESLSEMK